MVEFFGSMFSFDAVIVDYLDFVSKNQIDVFCYWSKMCIFDLELECLDLCFATSLWLMAAGISFKLLMIWNVNPWLFLCLNYFKEPNLSRGWVRDLARCHLLKPKKVFLGNAIEESKCSLRTSGQLILDFCLLVKPQNHLWDCIVEAVHLSFSGFDLTIKFVCPNEVVR